MEVKVKKVLSLHITKAGNAAEVSDRFACMYFPVVPGKELCVFMFLLRQT